jgi:N-methylhydantoinase A
MERETVTQWQATALLEMRYVGQSFSLRIPLASPKRWKSCLSAFHRAHKARYGHADTKEAVECIGIRLLAVSTEERPTFQITLPQKPCEPFATTALYWQGRWLEAPLYLRNHLAENQILSAPAIVLQTDATTFLAPGWQGRVDRFGNLLLEKREGLL